MHVAYCSSKECIYVKYSFDFGMKLCKSQAVWSHFYSLGADASSLSSIGHHLSGRELLALPDILQGHMIDSLKKIGLDIKSIGDTQTTIEEVQSLLHSLEQHEVASSLRQRLDFGKHLKLHGVHVHK